MRALLALGALLIAHGAMAVPRVAAQVIFLGTFFTSDPEQPIVKAIGVADGRIVLVGTEAKVLASAAADADRVRVHGFVLPGLADAHIHVEGVGEQLEKLDLQGLDKATALRRVAAAARRAPRGAWVEGGGWDEGFWGAAGFPTARELDAVSNGHPVVLDRIDGHSTWINSRVLAVAGIDRHTADPPGGAIRHDAQGKPTGILVDNAQTLLEHVRPKPTHADRVRRIQRALHQFARWGLTSVHDAGVDLETIAIYQDLLKQGALTVRVYAMLAGEEARRQAITEGPRPDVAEGRLAVRSFKLFLDGALGSRGAELSEPYTDAPETKGLELMSDSDLDQVIRLALAHGFQVNVHAIGDRAVHRALDAFERAGVGPSQRFRIEHASVVRDEDVPRFARLGVIASVQPVFVGEYSRWAEARVGPARVRWVLRTADLLASGARLAAGSDYPASDSGDPRATLVGLVTRESAMGTPSGGWYPGQSVPIAEALPLMWAGPAYAAFAEHDLGALTVGRYADFTVLDADPRTVLPSKLRSLEVRGTVVGGRIVYRRGAAFAREDVPARTG